MSLLSKRPLAFKTEFRRTREGSVLLGRTVTERPELVALRLLRSGDIPAADGAGVDLDLVLDVVGLDSADLELVVLELVDLELVVLELVDLGLVADRLEFLMVVAVLAWAAWVDLVEWVAWAAWVDPVEWAAWAA